MIQKSGDYDNGISILLNHLTDQLREENYNYIFYLFYLYFIKYYEISVKSSKNSNQNFCDIITVTIVML